MPAATPPAMKPAASPPMSSRAPRRSWLVAILIALALAAGSRSHDVRLAAAVASLVDPGRVTPGVLINITGTGFHKSAKYNDVVFTPEGAASVRVRAKSVTTIDAAGGLRRVAVLVPALPVGQVALRVINTVTGEESPTASAQIVSITPSVTSVTQGASLALVITGSPEAGFVEGTRVALGAGITVGAVTVESPTRLVAQISVDPAATTGSRKLDISAPGLAALAVVKVTKPTNTAPTVEAGPDLTASLSTAASLVGSGTDDGLPAGSVLKFAWSKVTGPGTPTFATPTSPTTSVTFSKPGTYVLRLKASDGKLNASDTVTVAVSNGPPTNAAPTVNAGTDQAVTLPNAAVLVGTVTDDGDTRPGGSTLTLQWSLVSGPGAPTIVTPTSASTSVTFPVAGVYVLQLTASDGALSSSDTVAITVTDVPPPPNVAPTVSAGADQAVTLPNAAALVGTATDDGRPEGSTLTLLWSLVSGPGAPTIVTPTSASTSVTFPVAGVYVLQLTASDGALSSSDTVAITVTDVPPTNVAPTVNAGADQAVTLPNAAALVGTATDDGRPEGSTLTLQWSLVSGPGAPTIVTPTSASTSVTFPLAGVYVLQLTASDGALSSSDTVAITVTDVPPTNVAPTVNAGADQAVTLPNAAASLTGNASDDGLPAGSTLTLLWSLVSGPGAPTIVTPTSASTSVTFPVAGVYLLQLTASDGALSSSDTVAITVTDVPPPTNVAPTVNAGADQAVTLPNAAASLTGNASDDGLPAGSTLTLLWSLVSGPGAPTIVTPTSASTSVTFPVAGVYVLQLTASDGALSSSDTVAITVTDVPPPTNVAPTVSAGADQAVTLPNAAALVGTATDDGRPEPAAR